jgi:hypothetical protein
VATYVSTSMLFIDDFVSWNATSPDPSVRVMPASLAAHLLAGIYTAGSLPILLVRQALADCRRNVSITCDCVALAVGKVRAS